MLSDKTNFIGYDYAKTTQNTCSRGFVSRDGQGRRGTGYIPGRQR